MGILEIIDGVIKPNGNRRGLSVGWTVVSWVSFLLSTADHRMSYVEAWAERPLETLRALLAAPAGMAVEAKDFEDDRLGDVLRYLSNDEEWAAIEAGIGGNLVSVYGLAPERVRLDSASASLYHEVEGASPAPYLLCHPPSTP
jgi:hypothetical protein